MKPNELSCAVVRDLLPSYVDKLTSEETNAAVEAHLSGCAACTEVLRGMRTPAPAAPELPREVDYLKKVRRHTRRMSAGIGLALLLAGIILISIRFFCIGTKAGPGDAALSAAVSGDTVTVSGDLLGSAQSFARMTFSSANGMVELQLYTSPAVFSHSGTFTSRYTAPVDITQVRFGDLILWENGAPVSNFAARLFAAKNPFVGDMSANSALASVLGLGEDFGPFTNELQTGAEPYGWTFCLETPVETEAAAQQTMRTDACILLACVENLGSVSFSYKTAAGPAVYTVTAEEASALAGQDIKACGASASALQALLETLGVKRALTA